MSGEAKPKFVVPSTQRAAFNCPGCGAYAHQVWWRLIPERVMEPPKTALRNVQRGYLPKPGIVQGELLRSGNPTSYMVQVDVSECAQCNDVAIWVAGRMVHPHPTGDLPVADEGMPPVARGYFNEARAVFAASVSAAAAMLRACAEAMCTEEGKTKDTFHDRIGKLVAKGIIDRPLQQIFDAARVTGNDAVHPNRIVTGDLPNIVAALFSALNIVSRRLFTEPTEIENLYRDAVPEDKRDAIARRDIR